MKLRIQGRDLPTTVMEAIGAIANKGLLRPQDGAYEEKERVVAFRFQRFPVVGKALFSGTRHSEVPITSRATIRNVLSCIIEDSGVCQEITILFGISFKENTVLLSSAEENRGTTCFTLECTVSEIDIEMIDE